jgi:hypothetical protein
MYHFEITKHKKKEEFALSLFSTKKSELLFKLEGFPAKNNAKKLAQKISGLTDETEIRDMTVEPKVDKTKTKDSVKPTAKKSKKSTDTEL